MAQVLDQLAHRRRPCLVMPTGSGKTRVFCTVASQFPGRVMILVHRGELLDQVSATLTALDVEHGLIAAQEPWYRSRRVQVASVQSLVRRLADTPTPDLVIIDECFPAGTLVDGKPIETVRPGDMISSYCHNTNQVVKRRVVRTFTNRPSSLLTINGVLICTGNHPIYKEGVGYVAASELSIGDRIAVMQPMSAGEGRPIRALEEKAVQRNGESVLLASMLKGISESHFVSDDAPHQLIEIGASQRPHEAAQPHGDAWRTGARRSSIAGHGAQATDTRRERQGAFVAATGALVGIVGGRHYCSSGAHSEDRAVLSDIQSAASLQARSSSDVNQIGNRDRREQSLRDGAAGSGSEERASLAFVRVDRLEVHQSTGDGTFGGLCADGAVYNLEVDGEHNYFANGFLVHNCHHCIPGNTWGKVLSAWPNALRWGVTATPTRLGGQGLADSFDMLVLGPTPKQLIAEKHLCDYRIFSPPAHWADALPRRGGDYARTEASQAASKPTITGNAVSHYHAVAPGTRALVFCVSRAHAQVVRDTFSSGGVRAEILDGSSDRGQRASRIRAFTAGSCPVLVTVDLVSEGFDVPAVETIISLRPTQSLTLWLQQVGRGLRPSPGKDKAVILDHAGNFYRHGYPDDDREWTLDGVSRCAGSGTGKGITVRTCGQCFEAVRAPATTCQTCGYVFPVESRVVEEVDGELVEMEKERVRIMQKREVGQARDLEALRVIEKQRGYKRGWSEYIWRARQAKQGVRR